MINKQLIREAYSYSEYRDLISKLIDEGKTTGPNQSESYVKYTELNFQRMKRLDKTIEIKEDLRSVITEIDREQVWLVLVEAWCGDVAQNLPAINKMAELNQHIELKLILRDEHLSVMDQYLTNGSRSIPKLVILSITDLKEIASWGPRPAAAQRMVVDYKKMDETDRPPYSELSEKLQRWYNRDKNQTIQEEFREMLKKLKLADRVEG